MNQKRKWRTRKNYAVTRHVTMRVRKKENENEGQGAVGLEDMRQREETSMQLEDNQQWELQEPVGITTFQRWK